MQELRSPENNNIISLYTIFVFEDPMYRGGEGC